MIKDIIESVVNEMRVFTASVVNDGSGVYTVTIAATDVQYWHVGARMGFLDSGTYYYGEVTSITSPDLVVLLDNTDNLSSITQFIMDINYKHGHPVDVFDQLGRMTVSKSLKRRLYPLIALMEDTEMDKTLGISTTPIQVIIGTHTEAKYTAAERYTYSFDAKRLTKIYERFIKYLRLDRSTYFRPSDSSETYRLYWGKVGALGNEDNKAYDNIDAIELNIELKTFENC